jgi:glycerophosphoryl diester phosphodiesterase
MSNFIIRQEGPSSVVADNIWEIRLGAVSFLVGALASALAIVAVGRYLGRRKPDAGVTPQGWPVNFAHRGGAKIAPENTLEGFREGLQVGAGVLELDVHTIADGNVVVIHDEAVERTTNGSGPVREMTLAEVKRLDTGSPSTMAGHTLTGVKE